MKYTLDIELNTWQKDKWGYILTPFNTYQLENVSVVEARRELKSLIKEGEGNIFIKTKAHKDEQIHC